MKIAAILFLFACLMRGQEVEFELKINQSPVRDTWEAGVYAVEFNVEILVTNNSAKTVRIATEALGPIVVNNKVNLSLYFRDAPVFVKKTHRIIPDEGSFRIVVLNPGEMTSIMSRDIEASVRGEDIHVEYEIDDFLADRFGVWRGKCALDGKLRLKRTPEPQSQAH